MNRAVILFLFVFTGLTSCDRSSEKYTRLSQLKGEPIAVITGTAADVACREYFPDAEKQNFYATTDAAFNVKIGKAAAFVFDKAVLQNIADSYPELTLIDEPVAEAEIAIAFNKSQIVLLEQINVALEKLKSDGTLKTMKEKWIDPGFQEVPALPDSQTRSKVFTTSPYSELIRLPDTASTMSDDDNVLKVGVCAQFPPMMFVSNNQITGFDMELAIRIGNLLGKKIQIVDMSFDSLILSLQAQKIDFAISNFDITEERKRFVNFSDPYFVQDISALVRK